MTWSIFSSGKSGKREIAVSLIIFWAFVTGYVFFYIPTAEVREYADPWSTMTWAVLAWAAAAFGIDFMVKSGAMGGQRQPTPSRRTQDHKPTRRDDPDRGID